MLGIKHLKVFSLPSKPCRLHTSPAQSRFRCFLLLRLLPLFTVSSESRCTGHSHREPPEWGVPLLRPANPSEPRRPGLIPGDQLLGLHRARRQAGSSPTGAGVQISQTEAGLIFFFFYVLSVMLLGFNQSTTYCHCIYVSDFFFISFCSSCAAYTYNFLKLKINKK